MKFSTRILASVLVLVIHPSTIVGGSRLDGEVEMPNVLAAVEVPAPQAKAPEPTEPPALAEVAIVGGNSKQRQAASKAVEHFMAAGLEPPAIVIEIHPSEAGCDGYDGTFRAREWRLDICNPHWMIVLHELAHAWEYATLTEETRQRFMELRGLTGWNDPGTPWKERGVEDLAEIVVWGLRVLSSTDQSPSDAGKEAAFELVTGIDVGARRPVERDGASVHRIHPDDLPAFDPEFDVWR